MVKILFVAEVNRRLEELDCADEVPINGLHIFHSYNNWLLGQNHACLGSWDDARIWKLRRTSAPLSSAQIDKLLKRGMETDNTDLLKSNELYQPSGRGDTSTNVALLITHSPSTKVGVLLWDDPSSDLMAPVNNAMTAHDGDWRFLTVCVRTQSTSNWTTNDLEHPAKNIITLWTDSNAHIQDSVLEDTARRLDETKRWLKDAEVQTSGYATIARHKLGQDLFDGFFTTKPSSQVNEINPVTESEMRAFAMAVDLYHDNAAEAARGTSYDLDANLRVILIQNPMWEFCRRVHQQRHLSLSGSGYGFIILVHVRDQNQVYVYKPNPDFVVLPADEKGNKRLEDVGAFPFVFCLETVSDSAESDRIRLLMYFVVCLRLMTLAIKPDSKPIVLMAIYMTKAHVAERYLAYAIPDKRANRPPQVIISRKSFQLDLRLEAGRFTTMLYNYIDLLERIDTSLLLDKRIMRKEIHNSIEQLQVTSLTSRKDNSRKLQMSRSRAGVLVPIVENDE